MKRSSRKRRLAKWSKLGLSLAAVTVLGGLVEPVGADFVSPKVYAETYVNTSDQPIGVVVYYSGQNLDGTKVNLEGWESYIEVQPGQEIAAPKEFEGYTLISTSYTPPVFSDGALLYVYSQNESIEQPKSEEPAGDANSSDTSAVSQPAETSDVIPTDTSIAPLTDSPTGNDIVNSTIQLVDQDGQILQTIQQSGAEGSEVRFEFPVISGYRVGKAEGFDGWNYMKEGTFRLAANKIVKVYYDKAPSIDALIRPEQRVEYQKVFDTFHATVLKAFEVYKQELGVDHILRLGELDESQEKLYKSEDIGTLVTELILVEYLFDRPVGLVLTDQDIINAIGWAPEYWDYQISYHKEITQELEKAMANIAAAKATPTDKPAEPPVEQPVEQPLETPVAPQPAETLVDPSVTKPVETPSEIPANSPAETPTNVQPSADQVGQSVTEPTVLSNQDSQAGTASPTGQSAPGKQETKQETKEQAAPASQSQQSTAKPAPTSQPQTKSLPATGEAHSVWHMTGLGLLGLAGLVVKRRSRKSS
ncbi:LPXTG cell wall anchor domain-containing protein [Streptococcus suis]|uniref:LPXTG cell wall anchor domain-containing protein n=1 Tax=Streptococcus suis TaxID=1307 RepID=UPI00177B8FAF|nr:LPXTG cell wall anchor domain-containing protein [Streptococcus suis]MBY4974504.1 LPXTG cell wall anchor domain-containing protein [Streptococcus suis]QOZ88397.1 LPXTG cell wall anchor domain-containing protein [Streptococcus suis]